MSLTNAEQIGLILGGTVIVSIGAAVFAYFHDKKKSVKPEPRRNPMSTSVRTLKEWSAKLGIEFDPNDPRDPLAALVAAGEYFRISGCEPGGPHYEETFQRVVSMIEDMVPEDRLDFWTDQVYKLYGTKAMWAMRSKKKE